MFGKRKVEVAQTEKSFVDGTLSNERYINDQINELQKRRKFFKELRRKVDAEITDKAIKDRIKLGIGQMIIILEKRMHMYKAADTTRLNVQKAQEQKHSPTKTVKTYLSTVKSLERQVKHIPNVFQKSKSSINANRFIEVEMFMLKDIMNKYMNSRDLYGKISDLVIEDLIANQTAIDKKFNKQGKGPVKNNR